MTWLAPGSVHSAAADLRDDAASLPPAKQAARSCDFQVVGAPPTWYTPTYVVRTRFERTSHPTSSGESPASVSWARDSTPCCWRASSAIRASLVTMKQTNDRLSRDAPLLASLGRAMTRPSDAKTLRGQVNSTTGSRRWAKRRRVRMTARPVTRMRRALVTAAAASHPSDVAT